MVPLGIDDVFIFMLILSKFYLSLGDSPCISRTYEFDSNVCICNATYCDTIDKIKVPLSGNYLLFTSSKSGLRFHKSIGSFKSDTKSKGAKLRINSDKLYQQIFGFGGAFTDSAGINILSLSEKAKDLLMRSYFSSEGIEYSLGRVPIGGTDFSTHGYAYQDNNTQANLTNFTLTIEDYNYKIPLIKQAQNLTTIKLNLVSSCWSPPVWMKTAKELDRGVLKPEYYRAYADYHVKFLDKYHEEGVDMWCITTGNEPVNGLLFINHINALGWTPTLQRTWIGDHLGPMIRSSIHNNTCIIAVDDQRYLLPWWLETVMKYNEAKKYISGVGVHWYWDFIIPSSVLADTHRKYPNLFLLNTEASYGDKPWDLHKVELGSWRRGEAYAADIIEDINNWISGWMDWNLALNEEGGPNWIQNYVDSPIIVNKTADEFYKQPMFYALGHFSKFIPRGSRRIGFDLTPDVLEVLAVNRPDGAIAIVILNKKSFDVIVTITDKSKGSVVLTIPKKSINTMLYK